MAAARKKPQRPKKRQAGGPPSRKDGEGPSRRLRKKMGAPLAVEAEGPLDFVEEDVKSLAKRQELAALETLLFGAPTSSDMPSEALPKGPLASPETKKRKRTATTSSSDTAAAAAAAEAAAEAEAAAAAEAAEGTAAEAAWVDPEDALLRIDIDANPKLRKLKVRKGERFISGEEYSKRLQSLHHKLVGKRQGLDWIEQARLRKAKAEIEAQGAEEAPTGVSATGQEGLLMSGEQLILSSGRRGPGGRDKGAPLAPTKISIRRLEDANKQGLSLCAVSCLEFHPKSNILLTAGRDKTLRLFLVDGVRNPRLESVHLKDFPILSASFSKHDGGQSLLLTSNAGRSIAEYDLQEGKLTQIPGIGGRRAERCFHHLCVSPGTVSSQSSPLVKTFAVASATSQTVLLCDASSKRLLDVFTMHAPVAGMAFHPHRQTSFLTADSEASVYEWDVRTGRCISKFHDAACLRLTAFAVSSPPPENACLFTRPSSVLALGSRTGFSDLFDVPVEGPVNSQPFKALGNLTTGVSSLCFHPQNEILCVASKWKKDALRLVHLPSGLVYQNWPTANTPMHYVSSAAFSTQKGLFAVGNDTGKVLLYQLRHYA